MARYSSHNARESFGWIITFFNNDCCSFQHNFNVNDDY